MKRLLMLMLVVSVLLGWRGAASARDQEPRWRLRDREPATREAGRDNGEGDGDHIAERLAERRERMRALREEMLRAQPRPQSYREDEVRRTAPADRREFTRQPSGRSPEGPRRLSPEERRQFRRQIYDAGRDVYRDQ